nr:MAG TPA: tRNA synthetase B5 domain [Caudoviricetes sp.]
MYKLPITANTFLNRIAKVAVAAESSLNLFVVAIPPWRLDS